MTTRTVRRRMPGILAGAAAILAGAATAVLGTCGPFTDTANDAFCPFVLEVFYLGITTGTTPTTYDPASNVTRLQMAAFLSRTVDGVLKRRSRRAALDQFWNTGSGTSLGVTTVGLNPVGCKADGQSIWVANGGDGTVSRVRASDGKLLGTWTGADGARGVVTGAGKVLISGATNPGTLYYLDPLIPGSVIVAAGNLGRISRSATYDGTYVWTANNGSVSIVKPKSSFPWTVTTVTTGFNTMFGPIYDGANVWVTNNDLGTLNKLDAGGAILLTVTVGANPDFPLYDGTNIWVPNFTDNSVSVVRASNGSVLATLTGNGLNQPNAATFDGQRVLVANFNSNSVSLFKGADLTAIGAFDVGGASSRACSDGLHLWFTLQSTNQLARF